MTNLFSTIKTKQTSKKFFLVRIEPARYINSLLTSIGGGKYTLTFTGVISALKFDGVALTKVTGTPASGEWAHDETTGLLTVYPASSLTGHALIMYYYLFYTNEYCQEATEDPEDSSTTLRPWEPRLVKAPTIRQSIEDVINGKLSLSTSTVTLINSDNDIQQYLTGNDSFYNKKIVIWSCLNSVDNIQKISQNKITGVRLSKSDVTFTVEDDLFSIFKTATMGDTAEEMNQPSASGIDPNKIGKAIPFCIGRLTPSSYYLAQVFSTSPLVVLLRLTTGKMLEASCIDYSDTISATTNRLLGCCRSRDGYVDFSCTPSNIDNSVASYTRLDVSVAESLKIFFGDTFVMTHSSTDYYFEVYYVDYSNGYIYVTKNATISTGDSIQGNNCPSVFVKNQNGSYRLYYGRDYTATTSTTSGGNHYLKITLADDFETTLGWGFNFDPSAHSVYFRAHPDITNASHAKTIKYLLELTGLTVNSTSITDADSTLTANAIMTIPDIGKDDYEDYYFYVEKILKAALGYLKLNNSFEIEYGLFTTPSSTTEISDIEILEDSITIDIKYKDMISQATYPNTYFGNIYSSGWGGDVISVKSKYLHDIDIQEVDELFPLESFPNNNVQNRVSDIMDVRGNRYATYSFETSTANIDSEIGDDILLSGDFILGGDDTKSVKIVEYAKGINKTQIIATDLYNL